jgi:hypothetical protein
MFITFPWSKAVYAGATVTLTRKMLLEAVDLDE